MSDSWDEVILFDEENIGGTADAFFTYYFVNDVDDIGSMRAPICPYDEDDLDEAIDHADNLGGFVTGFEGQVVYVSPKVDLFDVLHARRGRNGAAADQIIEWIKENDGCDARSTTLHQYWEGAYGYQVAYFKLPLNVELRTRDWRSAPDAQPERRQALVRKAVSIRLAQLTNTDGWVAA
ncbi:hypothetical protein NKG99_14340 [Mesorhizobium sp. M1409]|uniref:hypothetical protein n=1 Tax=unclassified Mesorhizobium TaxID=325217 RepID=UPI00333C8C9E